MKTKKITHNYNFEQKKMCNEEKLANCILKDSKVILNTKKEGEKLFFIFENISYGDHHIIVSYEKLLEIKEYLKKFENIISNSFIKYMEFLEEFKDKIIKEFKLGYKLKIGFEFKIIDKDEKNDSVFNINCLYKIYSSNLDNNILKKENILLNKTNSNTQGFIYLINEIKENNYDGIKFLKNAKKEIKKASGNNNNDPNNRDNPNTSNFSNETKELNLVSYSKSNEEIGLDLKMRASNYQILKIIGIIGKHENTAEFIKELSNGYYVSGGTDNILKIYDQDFNLKKELNDINEWIYSCFEIEKLSNQNENEYITELILCCNEKLFKIALSFKKEEIKIIGKYLKYKFPQLEIKNCVQMRENNFAIIGQNSYYFIDLFNSKNVQLEKSLIVSEKSYLASIKLNENIIAITSNKVQYKGEDKLIFYNTYKKTIEREIEGYSFTSGINGLALMPREEVKCNNKILLCACKKYFDDQKNGIYLSNPQLDDKQGINNPFYDTGSFEVFCFCPIVIINPNNNILEKGKKKEIIDTEYFFVGGFNIDKKEGEIKLFKVIYSEKARNNKIEFVQDIEFERNKDFNGFEGAVSCITLSKNNNGYILITCYNGKVYLLTKPNLDYYLENKNNKNIKEIKN